MGGSPVTGVDGCRTGWVGVDCDENGLVAVRVAATLSDLLRDTPEQHVVGIDMPLGLLGHRLAHGGPGGAGPAQDRAGVHFCDPPAPVWLAPAYADASQMCRRLTGNGFSIQAWGLRRKLLEAADYRLRCRHPLYEVHPELSFRAIAGAPLDEAKHTAAGQARRRRLLAAAGLVVPADKTPRRIAIDVLDAAAVAWTARRIAAGQAEVVPDPPQTDVTGREIAIRY